MKISQVVFASVIVLTALSVGFWLIVSSARTLLRRRSDPLSMGRSEITSVEAGVRIAIGIGLLALLSFIGLFALLADPHFENTLAILVIGTGCFVLILTAVALILAAIRRLQQN